MKRNRFTYGWAVVLLCLASPACRKNDGSSNRDLLAKAPWVLRSDQFIDPNGQYIEEIQDCQRDDTWTFHADETFDFLDNATKCDPDFSLDFSINWSLQDNENVLVFKFAFDEIRYRIAALDETTLELHKIDPFSFNQPTVEKIRFGK